MTAVSQAEFARRMGVNRAYVTRLKQAGRLVVTQEGKVDVEASLRRIRETGGARPDVAQRFAQARSGEAPADADQVAAEDQIGESYQRARAVKEKFLALTAKAEYERLMRTLVPREAVEDALDDLVARFRSGLDTLPTRLAGQLVGKDRDAIFAIIKTELMALIRDLHDSARQARSEMFTEASDGRA